MSHNYLAPSNISIPGPPIPSRNGQNKNSKRLCQWICSRRMANTNEPTPAIPQVLCIFPTNHGSGFRHINLSWSAQIIAIPIPACAAYTSRLLDIVHVGRGRAAALSLSAATRAAASNWRPVADVRCIAPAPRTGKSEYSPQPKNEEGPCDRADNDTRDPTAADCAWAVIAA